MANKHRCEIPFPDLGEGIYMRFTLDELIELETHFGETFFNEIETGGSKQSPAVISKCLRIGLKKRDPSDLEVRAYDDIDFDKIQDEGFTHGDAFSVIMDALSQSWLNKSYEQLIKDAEDALKQREAKQKQQMVDVVKEAASVAKEANIPFDQEGSLETLLKLLTNQELLQTPSGD